MPRPKSKTVKKKSSKKARPVKAEIVPCPRLTEADKKSIASDLPQLKQRMTEMWSYTKAQLNSIKKDPASPISDLVILRWLFQMREYGDLPMAIFYIDTIFGGSKLLGGPIGGSDDDGLVTLVELPVNGSEFIE